MGVAILLITHDLGVIAETCDRVAVMCAGRIVEQGNVHQIFRAPRHPYTRALLRSIPHIQDRQSVLPAIEGTVPNLVGLRADSCYFADRCPDAMPQCLEQGPASIATAPRQGVACHLYGTSTDSDVDGDRASSERIGT